VGVFSYTIELSRSGNSQTIVIHARSEREARQEVKRLYPGWVIDSIIVGRYT